MVIVLKDADFSANNIGKLNVEPINAFTLAAIEASHNDSMTENQIAALNEFFYTIGAWSNDVNRIIAKMRYIYLPIICKQGNMNTLSDIGVTGKYPGDVAYSLVNYADANFAIPIGNYNRVPITPKDPNNGGTAVLRNGGLVALDSTTGLIGARMWDTDGDEFITDALSILWLRTESFATMDNPASNKLNRVSYIRGYKTDSSAQGLILPIESFMTVGNVELNLGSNISNIGYHSFDKANDVIAAAGISVRSDNGGGYLLWNGVGESLPSMSLNTVITQGTGTGECNMEDVYAISASTLNDAAAIGVVMIGDALSDAEMQSVAGAINVLRDAFLA